MMRDTIGLLFPASLVALSISTAGMYRCAAQRECPGMAAATREAAGDREIVSGGRFK